MSNLKIFAPVNGIYAGVNTPQFSQLEYLISRTNQTTRLPNLGLFGEASTGKTTTANLIARAINYEFVSFNASGLSVAEINTAVVNKIKKLHDMEDNNYKVTYNSKTKLWSSPWKPILIFIDEAQELAKDVQTALLSVLDLMSANGTSNASLIETKKNESFDMSSVCFILATTDTSKLLYPLTTRLQAITFDQYSKEDISNIIALKYNRICKEGREIIANCSKLVPRVALRLAEQLSSSDTEKISREQTVDFVKNFLNMEENGIDSIDKRILLYLSNHKKKIEPVDIISLDMMTQQKEKLLKKASLSNAEHKELNRLTFQIMVTEQRINSAEFTPKSRQDISLACRILDLNDLETRLTFLEKLEFITKSSKGIMLHEAFL